MSTKIDQQIIDVLKQGQCSGNTLTFNTQLDRPTYQKLNKVLEALGGKWNRKAKGHVFEREASQVLDEVLQAEAYTDEKKEYELFETPTELARELVERAGVKKGDTVLEPSAGKGKIVEVLFEVGAKVTAVELNPTWAELLKVMGCEVVQGDFLKTTLDAFDRVVMNPPFSKGQDMQHVQHAWKFLKEGGTLVAVMSPHFTFANSKKAENFRSWAEYVHATWEPLPDGSFKESGTNVKTVVFSATKR